MPPKTIQIVPKLETKFDETAFKISQERNDFLLPQIIDFVRSKRWVNIRPEYQRRLVWDTHKQSKFIESLLLNIPIPQIFLFETDLSRYEVMDGQQRLNSIIGFYNNEFELKGLDKWKELNGYRYSELPEKLQRGIDRRRLSATVLVLESAKQLDSDAGDIRKLVFERLNTGGQQLNAQELRNCLYAGPFNDMLITVARSRNFAKIWNIPVFEENVDSSGQISHALARNRIYSRMLDCEIALRFFAFRHSDSLKGSVQVMLDRCMYHNKSISTEHAQLLANEFSERLSLAYQIFGDHAFKYKDKNGRWKPSQPLFDGLMIALDQLWSKRTLLEESNSKAKLAVHSLLEEERNLATILGKPNTAKAIAIRIKLIKDALEAAAA
jgi:hypothetical protein